MVLLKTSGQTTRPSLNPCKSSFYYRSVRKTDLHASWPSEAPGQYIGLFRNLARAIRNNEEPEVKWAETTQVIEMIELAYKSSKEARTLVL